jgi:hypothetical protein
MIIRYLSWEGPGHLLIGADQDGSRKYARTDPAPGALPDIVFRREQANCQRLRGVVTFPPVICVQEETGSVFAYTDTGF